MITKCPCCGWGGFKKSPANEDEAILSCEWCTRNLLGKPHLCAKAQEITDRRKGEWECWRCGDLTESPGVDPMKCRECGQGSYKPTPDQPKGDN